MTTNASTRTTADKEDRIRRTMMVADLGWRHGGNFGQAARMVTAAFRAGADAVKFPIHRTERCLSPATNQEFAQWKRWELRRSELSKLADLAEELGIELIVAPQDLESIDDVAELRVRFKVGSGDNDFLPLLSQIAATGKPILLSTGGSDLDRISRSVDTIQGRWLIERCHSSLTLMHAVCWEPTPAQATNLRAIATLGRRFDLPLGYADHCQGVEACVLAVSAGAVVVEKEFVLSEQEITSDSTAVCPAGFATLVDRVRTIEMWLGDGRKRVQEGERLSLRQRRRSIVAIRDLPAGHQIVASDLTWLRPACGLPPGCELLLVGNRLRHPILKHQPVQLDDVQVARAA